MSVVRGREASPRNDDILCPFRNQRSIWNSHHPTVWDIVPPRIGTLVMIFNRSTAERDLIFKLACREHVFLRQACEALNPSSFADTNLCSHPHEVRVFVAWNHILEEPHVLECLFTCGSSRIWFQA